MAEIGCIQTHPVVALRRAIVHTLLINFKFRQVLNNVQLFLRHKRELHDIINVKC